MKNAALKVKFAQWLLIIATTAVLPAHANIYNFVTPADATSGTINSSCSAGCGSTSSTSIVPVEAKVSFDIVSPGTMVVTLTNLEPNIISVGQNISSLFFTLGNFVAGNSDINALSSADTVISGKMVNVTSTNSILPTTSFSASVTSNSSGPTLNNPDNWTHWTNDSTLNSGYSVNTNVVASNQMFLNDLGGTGTPTQTIIGPPTSPSGDYTYVNGSIYDNPHNPFIQNTATFTIKDAGLLTSTTVSNVMVGFGTAVCNTPVRLVPEPDTWVLFGLGIAAMGVASHRRCRKNSRHHSS